MESIENFRLQIIFRNISYLINNRIIDLPKSSQSYLEQANFFFDNLIKSLDSLNYKKNNIDTSTPTAYHFLPNLKEIVSLIDNTSPKLKSDDLEKAKKFFTLVKSEINLLNSNPNKFYSSTNVELIKEIADRISEIYTDNYLLRHSNSELRSLSFSA